MRKGQSVLEYTVLMVIVVAAFLTMQVYVKRAFQGRWKQSLDDLGEQYDSNAFMGNLRHSVNTYSESRISVVSGVLFNGENGLITLRTDSSLSSELKQINSHINPGHL